MHRLYGEDESMKVAYDYKPVLFSFVLPKKELSHKARVWTEFININICEKRFAPL